MKLVSTPDGKLILADEFRVVKFKEPVSFSPPDPLLKEGELGVVREKTAMELLELDAVENVATVGLAELAEAKVVRHD